MDREDWHAVIHGVAKSRTWLSNWTELNWTGGLPGSSAGKEASCKEGELGLIPGLRRSPGEGNSYPLQYSGLENSMDCIAPGVLMSGTQLSDFHFHFHMWTLSWGMWPSSLTRNQMGPLHWERGVLATGQARKSLEGIRGPQPLGSNAWWSEV